MAGLEAVALFAQGLGIVAQAGAQFYEARNAAQAEAYNAALARQRADAVGESAKLELYRARKQAESFLGTQRAQYSKAGVRVNTGSPLEVAADSAAELELDSLITQYNLKTQQNQELSKAAIYDYSARQSKILSIIRPATTLLTQGADFATKIGTGTAKKTR